MLSCWALLVVGVSSRPPDASTHAPHGRGLRASGTAAFLTEEEQLQAAIALVAHEQQLNDSNVSDNSSLRVLNGTDRNDRKFPVAWSLGALGAFPARHRHEEFLPLNASNETHYADNSSLPGLNETEAPRRFFSPLSWQLGAMSAHPSAEAQQGAQNSSQRQQEQMNITTEDRPRMMLSWRFGGMAAMVPEPVNVTDNATATATTAAAGSDALSVANTDSSRAKIGFGWGLGAMSVANAMERQQEEEQVLPSASPSPYSPPPLKPYRPRPHQHPHAHALARPPSHAPPRPRHRPPRILTQAPAPNPRPPTLRRSSESSRQR